MVGTHVTDTQSGRGVPLNANFLLSNGKVEGRIMKFNSTSGPGGLGRETYVGERRIHQVGCPDNLVIKNKR